MHPNLESLTLPLNVSPEPFRFSETIQDTLDLRVGAVSVKDQAALQYHLDNIDSALAEVIDIRCQAAFALGDIRKQIKILESEYYSSSKVIKEAERLFNGDLEHMDLKSTFMKLEAVVKLCDSAEDLLKSKYFEIGRKARG